MINSLLCHRQIWHYIIHQSLRVPDKFAPGFIYLGIDTHVFFHVLPSNFALPFCHGSEMDSSKKNIKVECHIAIH